MESLAVFTKISGVHSAIDRNAKASVKGKNLGQALAILSAPIYRQVVCPVI